MSFIYSNRYYADIGFHVFPIIKYQRVFEKLVKEAGLNDSDFFDPASATEQELLLVHTPEYLQDLADP